MAGKTVVNDIAAAKDVNLAKHVQGMPGIAPDRGDTNAVPADTEAARQVAKDRARKVSKEDEYLKGIVAKAQGKKPEEPQRRTSKKVTVTVEDGDDDEPQRREKPERADKPKGKNKQERQLEEDATAELGDDADEDLDLPTEDEDDADDEASDTDPDDDQEEEEGDDDPAMREHRERAMRLVGKKTLDKLDDADIVELSKRQQRIERQQAQGRQAAPDQAAKATAAAGTKEGTQAPDPLDLDKAVDSFVKTYGQEAAEPAKAMLKPFADAARAQREETRAMRAEFQETLDRAGSVVLEMALESVRAGLMETFPQLEDDGEWEAVHGDIEDLLATKKHKSGGLRGLREVAKKAAGARYADALVAKQERANQRKHKAESNRPFTRTTRGDRGPLKPEQAEEAIGMQIIAGKRGEDARRAVLGR